MESFTTRFRSTRFDMLLCCIMKYLIYVFIRRATPQITILMMKTHRKSNSTLPLQDIGHI